MTLSCTVSYSINECNFNSVKWELGDKKVQKNVHMVYEHPLFISKKKKCEKVCTKKKLDSYFCPRVDSNPQTLQNVTFERDVRSTTAATTLCSKFCDYTSNYT